MHIHFTVFKFKSMRMRYLKMNKTSRKWPKAFGTQNLEFLRKTWNYQGKIKEFKNHFSVATLL